MNNDPMPSDATRLLDRAFHLAGGDTHKPIDLQKAWLDLGLPVGQMRNHLVWLVENDYLQTSESQGKPVVYLSDKTIERVAAIKTRR